MNIILIGDPVAHSRSPKMQNAAFAHLGLDLSFAAVHTPLADLPLRVAALRGPDYLGANVTLPHKQAVIPLLDTLEPEAARIGAVNVIYKGAGGALVGANTDAPGLLEDLREGGMALAGMSVVLLGASGAARAAAFALVGAGLARLTIANRSLGRAADLVANLRGSSADQPPPDVRAIALDDIALPAIIAAADLLINATSLGWHADETPLPNPPVSAHTLVYDMVYRETRLLREAAAQGARTRDGAGMLVHQGALALTRWTGRTAPIEIMWAAFRSALTPEPPLPNGRGGSRVSLSPGLRGEVGVKTALCYEDVVMLTAALVLIVGLFLGALLNVLIVRIPREGRILGWPRCTYTGAPLAWWQLLPVAGWAIQRGRAANGTPIHWIYPLVELISGLALLRIYQIYGLRPVFFYLTFVCAVLIVTGAIDWLHRWIYTFVILGAALVALVVGPLVGMNWVNVTLGALAAGIVFTLLYGLARILFPGHAAPFGLGDVYLAIFIGASVGVVNLLPALFYGMLMAGVAATGIIVVRRAGRPTPDYISYGSYLCLGVVLFIALGGLG